MQRLSGLLGGGPDIDHGCWVHQLCGRTHHYLKLLSLQAPPKLLRCTMAPHQTTYK